MEVEEKVLDEVNPALEQTADGDIAPPDQQNENVDIIDDTGEKSPDVSTNVEEIAEHDINTNGVTTQEAEEVEDKSEENDNEVEITECVVPDNADNANDIPNAGPSEDSIQLLTVSSLLIENNGSEPVEENENELATELAEKMRADQEIMHLTKLLTETFGQGDLSGGDALTSGKDAETETPDTCVDEAVNVAGEGDGQLQQENGEQEGPDHITELDDFFGIGQTSKTQVQFPALENVDFETDEEGQEIEVVPPVTTDQGENLDNSISTTDDQQKEDEKGDQASSSNGAEQDAVQSERQADGSLQKDAPQEGLVAIVSRAGQEGDKMKIAFVNSSNSPHKDYPLNYQNYKFCRELQPGIQECLILETGELSLNYMDNSESGKEGSSVLVVQQTNSESGRQGPGVPDVAQTRPDGSDEQQPYAGKFGGQSFEKSVKPGYIFVKEGEAELPGQQAYIMESGVPVILDNAEDDVKIGLKQEIGRLGMGMKVTASGPKKREQPQTSSDIGGKVVESLHSRVKRSPVGAVLREQQLHSGLEIVDDVVEDVLSSEEENVVQRGKEPKVSVKKPRKEKDKKERFYELQPDPEGDGIEDASPVSEAESNVNKNLTREGPDSQDTNNNMGSVDEDRTDRFVERNINNSANERLTLDSRDRLHICRTDRSATSGSNRASRSRDNSSYFRSSDANATTDSSLLSTRYSRLEQPDARSATRPESATVPKFKTLQDQQMSWLEMFKMIEAQHRSELNNQYLEHQQILQDMQQNMERELNKQQDTLKQRLTTHREILKELSPRGVRPEALSDNRNQSQSFEEDMRSSQPSRRYLESEFSQSSYPADTSLSHSSVSLSRDKQLRGGVYSSPMPLAKVRHKNSPRSSKPQEDRHERSQRDEGSRNSNAVHWDYEKEPRPASIDASLTEMEDMLSPRSKTSLREKHAKHLADLRAYYEEELREMRQLLAARQAQEDSSGDGRGAMSAGERILAAENHELRQRYQQLEDDHHDAKIQIRELQQKLQALEIRSGDYAERYDTAQATVLSLRNRLEELTAFAKEKESAAAELEVKNKRNTESLQFAYKKEKDLTESLHNAKTTIERLVDKYETLEKDHDLLKENMTVLEDKLYSSRSEVMEANNKMSRLELECKQLKHDNEILRHDLAMAKSSTSLRTSYTDAYQGSPSANARIPRSPVSSAKTRPSERPFRSLSQDRHGRYADQSPDSEESGEFIQSPILKAEQELKKLQKSMEEKDFIPKLQRKFYGTEVTGAYKDGVSTSLSGKKSSPSYQLHKTVDSKSVHSSPQQSRDSREVHPLSRSSSLRDNKRHGKEKNADMHVVWKRQDYNAGSPSSQGKKEKPMSSDAAMEGIKSGDIVSRPAWEDVYTSMAQPPRSGKSASSKSASSMTRDQIIQERLLNIENLERKYDDLQRDKRKFESALSKLPMQGHRREKERLEQELDRVDKELGSVRMSLKRFHVLKSTI